MVNGSIVYTTYASLTFIKNYDIILKKDKIYLLEHYDGNIRELIDEYFSYKKNNTYFCEKYYCRSCLKLSYDISLDSKTEKTFICPVCKDHCSCSRCFRNDQLIKIIACYISVYWCASM